VDPVSRLDRAEPACWSWPVPPASASHAGLVEQLTLLLGDSDAGLTRRVGRLLAGDHRTQLRYAAFHDGRCAVCGKRPEVLVVDHCHWSGLVRGYLCHGCNNKEGADMRGDRPLFAMYRRRHPSVILEYFESYKAGGNSQVLIAAQRVEERRRQQVELAQASMTALADEFETYAEDLDEIIPRAARGARKAVLICRADWAVEDRRLTLRDLLEIVREVVDHAIETQTVADAIVARPEFAFFLERRLVGRGRKYLLDDARRRADME
jgi:hypothetical protein